MIPKNLRRYYYTSTGDFIVSGGDNTYAYSNNINDIEFTSPINNQTSLTANFILPDGTIDFGLPMILQNYTINDENTNGDDWPVWKLNLSNNILNVNFSNTPSIFKIGFTARSTELNDLDEEILNEKSFASQNYIVSASVPSNVVPVDPDSTTIILLDLAQLNGRVKDIEDLLGRNPDNPDVVDGNLIVKSELGTEYPQDTFLEDNIEFFIKDPNDGISKHITLEQLRFIIDGDDKGRFINVEELFENPETEPGVGNDLVGAYAGIETPSTFTKNGKTLTTTIDDELVIYSGLNDNWLATGDTYLGDLASLEARVTNLEQDVGILQTDKSDKTDTGLYEDLTTELKAEILASPFNETLAGGIDTINVKLSVEKQEREDADNNLQQQINVKVFEDYTEYAIKVTPVDNDTILINDFNDSGIPKRVSLSNLATFMVNKDTNKQSYNTTAELLSKYPNNIVNPNDRSGWFAFVDETHTYWKWSINDNAWFDSLDASIELFVEQVVYDAFVLATNNELQRLEDEKIAISEKGAPLGVATLGSDGKVIDTQLPESAKVRLVYPNVVGGNGTLELGAPSGVGQLVNGTTSLVYAPLKTFSRVFTDNSVVFSSNDIYNIPFYLKNLTPPPTSGSVASSGNTGDNIPITINAISPAQFQLEVTNTTPSTNTNIIDKDIDDNPTLEDTNSAGYTINVPIEVINTSNMDNQLDIVFELISGEIARQSRTITAGQTETYQIGQFAQAIDLSDVLKVYFETPIINGVGNLIVNTGDINVRSNFTELGEPFVTYDVKFIYITTISAVDFIIFSKEDLAINADLSGNYDGLVPVITTEQVNPLDPQIGDNLRLEVEIRSNIDLQNLDMKVYDNNETMVVENIQSSTTTDAQDVFQTTPKKGTTSQQTFNLITEDEIDVLQGEIVIERERINDINTENVNRDALDQLQTIYLELTPRPGFPNDFDAKYNGEFIESYGYVRGNNSELKFSLPIGLTGTGNLRIATALNEYLEVLDYKENNIIADASNNGIKLDTLFDGVSTNKWLSTATREDLKATDDETIINADDIDDLSTNKLNRDGTQSMTGNLNMGSKKITTLSAGTSGTDAVNKTQMETADALKVSKSGDTMSGLLSMGNFKITNLGTPTSGTDGANKTYVDGVGDAKLKKSGDTMSGTLNMDSNRISGLPTPIASNEVATKDYVDSNALSSSSLGTFNAGSQTNSLSTKSSGYLIKIENNGQALAFTIPRIINVTFYSPHQTSTSGGSAGSQSISARLDSSYRLTVTVLGSGAWSSSVSGTIYSI